MEPDLDRFDSRRSTVYAPDGVVATLRDAYPTVAGLLPHTYEITDPGGGHVGNIDAAFSVRDRYEITIDDASDVPKEPIVAAAMVIDAIQNN